MSNKERTPETDKKTDKKADKRTWQAPSFKTGKLFESNSLACGKMPVDEMCQQIGIQTS